MKIYANSLWTTYSLKRNPNGELYWDIVFFLDDRPNSIELPLYQREEVYINGFFCGRVYLEGDLDARSV